jgi:hypothetical protein
LGAIRAGPAGEAGGRRSPVTEEDRTTAKDLPLARSVNEPQLARPVSGEREEDGREEEKQASQAAEQEETSQVEEEQPESARAEGEQGERGLIDRVVDEAQERGLVSGQRANEIREKGKGLIEKVRDRLSGR